MRQSAAKLLVSQAAILLCASLVSLQPADRRRLEAGDYMMRVRHLKSNQVTTTAKWQDPSLFPGHNSAL